MGSVQRADRAAGKTPEFKTEWDIKGDIIADWQYRCTHCACSDTLNPLSTQNPCVFFAWHWDSTTLEHFLHIPCCIFYSHVISFSGLPLDFSCLCCLVGDISPAAHRPRLLGCLCHLRDWCGRWTQGLWHYLHSGKRHWGWWVEHSLKLPECLLFT